MDRRAADLRAGADGSASAPWSLTSEESTVRVGGDGGGRPGRVCHERPGSRLRRGGRAEGCLAQRRELECRSHGTAHQLAERALVRSTGRQRWEHVFVKVGGGSDGTGCGGHARALGFGSNTPKTRPDPATDLAAGGAVARGAGDIACGRGGPGTAASKGERSDRARPRRADGNVTHERGFRGSVTLPAHIAVNVTFDRLATPPRDVHRSTPSDRRSHMLTGPATSRPPSSMRC